jgi:hypothetical protein
MQMQTVIFERLTCNANHALHGIWKLCLLLVLGKPRHEEDVALERESVEQSGDCRRPPPRRKLRWYDRVLRARQLGTANDCDLSLNRLQVDRADELPHFRPPFGRQCPQRATRPFEDQFISPQPGQRFGDVWFGHAKRLKHLANIGDLEPALWDTRLRDVPDDKHLLLRAPERLNGEPKAGVYLAASDVMRVTISDAFS